MSLTPIYDDLLREFEGIILVSQAAEAVQTAAGTETTSGTLVITDEPATAEATTPAAPQAS